MNTYVFLDLVEHQMKEEQNKMWLGYKGAFNMGMKLDCGECDFYKDDVCEHGVIERLLWAFDVYCKVCSDIGVFTLKGKCTHTDDDLCLIKTRLQMEQEHLEAYLEESNMTMEEYEEYFSHYENN